MDYIGILKDSYKIAIRNRYLWIFAILAGGIGGGNANFSMPSSSTTADSEKWTNFVNNFSYDQFINQYWGVLVVILGLIILFGLFWFILSNISQGAILGSVEAISKGEKSNFKLGFLFGWRNFWKVFATGLVMGLIVIFTLLVLIGPIVLFIVGQVYVLAIIYGILVFFIDLVLWIYLGLLYPYILRTVILGKKGIWQTYCDSWQFFTQHWKNIVIMYLLVVAVGLVVGICFVLAFLLVGGLLAAIGYAIYLASQAVFWLYAVIFGLILIIAFFIAGGVINTFNSSVLTLTYLKLTKKA